MRRDLFHSGLALTLLWGMLLVQLAHAAPPLPPHLRGAFAPVSQEGNIERFMLNVHGHVDGFLFKDGLQVAMPPHMGEAAAGLWKPGERVRVDGFRGVRAIQAQIIRAWRVQSPEGPRTLTDQPGRPPPKVPPPGPVRTFSGSVAQVLLDLEGRTVGAVLGDGRQLRWEVEQEFLQRPLLRGARVTGTGSPVTGRWGSVMVVRNMSISGEAE